MPSGGIVRALAVPGATALDLGASTVAQRQFGRAKNKWRVTQVDSEESAANNQARLAIDDDPSTFWHTQWRTANPDYPHEIVIDLGETLALAGFTYLPRQDGADGGLVAKYEFYVAEDSNRWGDPAAKGEFANILNNPILQRVMFDKPLSGRYIRLHALASPNNKPWAGAAEIDVIEARD